MDNPKLSEEILRELSRVFGPKTETVTAQKIQAKPTELPEMVRKNIVQEERHRTLDR